MAVLVFAGRHLFDILFEDSNLLVLHKPAGLVCHPTKTDEYSSLISRTRLYLGAGVQPQLVNRLDRETSGVTLVAKTREAAREVRFLWENRQVTKDYLAVVHGHVMEDQGTIETCLGKDEQSRVAIKDCVRPDGVLARTRFQVEARFERAAGDSRQTQAFTLVRVQPHTGRKHQIRIHLAWIGHPIVGDKLYGANEDLYLALVEDRLTEADRRALLLPYHALHAVSVRFDWKGRSWAFESTPEPWFTEFLPLSKALSGNRLISGGGTALLVGGDNPEKCL